MEEGLQLLSGSVHGTEHSLLSGMHAVTCIYSYMVSMIAQYPQLQFLHIIGYNNLDQQTLIQSNYCEVVGTLRIKWENDALQVSRSTLLREAKLVGICKTEI